MLCYGIAGMWHSLLLHGHFWRQAILGIWTVFSMHFDIVGITILRGHCLDLAVRLDYPSPAST